MKDERIYELIDEVVEKMDAEEYMPVSKKLKIRSAMFSAITGKSTDDKRTIVISNTRSQKLTENEVVIKCDDPINVSDCVKAAFRMCPDKIAFDIDLKLNQDGYFCKWYNYFCKD